MQRCLVDQGKQASRLLNHSGVTDIPQPLNLDRLESGQYQKLLNASKLYNETLVTCNKTDFLTVRGAGLQCSLGEYSQGRTPNPNIKGEVSRGF